MVLFPTLYQSSGWIPVSVLLTILTIYTLLCSIMIFECMSSIPGNHQFQRRIEYTTLCRYYFKPFNYQLVQLFYQCSLLAVNITTIIQSITVCDYVLIALFDSTCGAELYPSPSLYCTNGYTAEPLPSYTNPTPFNPAAIVISTGFCLCAVLCVPLGLYNLDDNIHVQQLSCIGVVVICIIWCILFDQVGFDVSRVPVIGSSYTDILGVCIFNYAIITSLPSWVNEKRPDVSIGYTLLLSTLFATASFIAVGVCGALAFDHTHDTIHINDNILTHIYNMHNTLATITYYAWPVVVNFTSIPIFAIMMRYNLIENNVCRSSTATFIAVFMPWIISIILYTGGGFTNIVTFSGLLVSSMVNFIIPPVLYIHYCKNHIHGTEIGVSQDIIHIIKKEKRNRGSLAVVFRF